MGLVSMTGFARHEGAEGDVRWHWEMRTVNGRNLDIRCRLAPGYESMEPKVRAAVAKAIRRGACQISLNVRRDLADARFEIDEAVLENVLGVIQDMRDKADIAAPSADGLLALKGVIVTAEPGLAADSDSELEAALLSSLDQTLAALVDMRTLEGDKMHAVLTGKLGEVKRLVEQARDNPTRKPDAIKKRLEVQLARLLETTDKLDDIRLHQEAAMLATRADIQEELDRLFAHIETAGQLFEATEPAGRRLEFLIQEFNREANTLCAKSNHASVTAIGLELKSVIDQMREQVQNIE